MKTVEELNQIANEIEEKKSKSSALLREALDLEKNLKEKARELILEDLKLMASHLQKARNIYTKYTNPSFHARTNFEEVLNLLGVDIYGEEKFFWKSSSADCELSISIENYEIVEHLEQEFKDDD